MSDFETFAGLLRHVAERRGVVWPAGILPEPLAALDYDTELDLKEEALRSFWHRERLPGRLERIVPAPVPRGYRTTSKRRAVRTPKGLALTFPGVRSIGRGVARSALDRPEHQRVYRFVLDWLAQPSARVLAAMLNWVIVRGSADRLAIILNVRMFDARVVRSAKQLGEDMRAALPEVCAGFLFLDPSESNYYLESRRPVGTMAFKRLFGPDSLTVDIGDVRLHHPPTVFSQVNEAMLETMVEAAGVLLGSLRGRALLDLFCGYGLFSLTLGREADRVLGVDFDGPAVDGARGNARHLRCGNVVRFQAGRIDGAYLANHVARAEIPEAILLDPPRQGTDADVAEVLASRRPVSVVHICCGTDEIPREVEAWERVGYRLDRGIPLDLFAGTAGLETLLHFAAE